MKKNLPILLLALMFFSFGANAMTNSISKTSTLQSKHDLSSPFEIRIPSGNIRVEKGGPSIKVDYYFEYVYKGKPLNDDDLNQIFSKCNVDLSSGVLTYECSKPKKGWINSYFHITVPENLSVSIFSNASNVKIKGLNINDLEIGLHSGKLSISNTNIHGAFNLAMQTGELSIEDSSVKHQTSIEILTGKVDIEKVNFRADSQISVKSGKVIFQYDPKKTGRIVYADGKSRARNRVSSADKCSPEERVLICNPKLSETNIRLDTGSIEIYPIK